MRVAVKVLFLLTIACTSAPATPSPDGTITLRFGESAVVGGTRISFTDVNDSRCPKDVVCVWEGDVAVSLSSANQTVVLHTSERGGDTEATIGDAVIELVGVEPERESSEHAVETAAYVVTLRISSR